MTSTIPKHAITWSGIALAIVNVTLVVLGEVHVVTLAPWALAAMLGPARLGDVLSIMVLLVRFVVALVILPVALVAMMVERRRKPSATLPEPRVTGVG